MNRKRIYNPSSNENLTDRRVFNGNPHGILNFTKAKYQWALKLWDLMEANTWFPKEVDTSGDVRDYAYNLTQAEKRMYDLVWSQLISMDSFQTNNLADNINPYITAPEINACLARLPTNTHKSSITAAATPGWNYAATPSQPYCATSPRTRSRTSPRAKSSAP